MLENSTHLERDRSHQRKKALEALNKAKEQEAEKIASGKHYTRLNNKTIVLR